MKAGKSILKEIILHIVRHAQQSYQWALEISVFPSCSSSSLEMAIGRHLPGATPFGVSSLAETGEPVTRCLCNICTHPTLCGYPTQYKPLMQNASAIVCSCGRTSLV